MGNTDDNCKSVEPKESEENSSFPSNFEHKSDVLNEYAQKRLKQSLEVVIAIACHDYDKKAEVTGNNDDFDGLNTGLNMLGEELQSSTVSRDYLDDIFDSMSEMLMVIDFNGAIKSCNNTVKTNLQYRDDQITEKRISDIIKISESSEQLQLNEKGLSQLRLQKKVQAFEAKLISNNGTYIPVEVSFSFMRNEKGIVCLMKDITEKLESKKEQDKLLRHLSKSNKELREFAYILSHDLKAPLRGISMLAQWIHDENQSTFNSETAHNLKLLMNRIKRLFGFIEGVFEYSKVGQVNEQHTAVDMKLLLAETIDSLALPSAVKVNIKSPLPIIRASKTHMTQLFQNLISNAVKHALKPDVIIEIEHQETPNFDQFSISDNGPGIAEKHFNRIFQIFQTLVPKDKVENTGIGLTIVKKLVGHYNGRIWVESKPGIGSSFHFTLAKDSQLVDSKVEKQPV